MKSDILTTVKAKPSLRAAGRVSLRSCAFTIKQFRTRRGQKAGMDIGDKEWEYESAYAPWNVTMKLFVNNGAKNNNLLV